MRRLAISVAVVLTVLAAGCGDDDDEGGDEPTPIEVTLTDESIEGLPDELSAGLLDVTVVDETDAAGGEVNFTRVEEGSSVDDFAADLAPIFEGGAFPDYWLGNAGVVDHSVVILDPGEYVVWIDLASDLDRTSTEDDIVTASLTVGDGDDDATLPDADRTITAEDYAFAVDVTAGPGTINFANTGPEQFHHALLVDFGTNDAATIEENLPAILEAEGPDDLPEDVDGEEIDFEFAVSGVFGPGSAGTFEADFQAGNTYAVLCFIQDRSGGEPHAIQNEMYSVFAVEE